MTRECGVGQCTPQSQGIRQAASGCGDVVAGAGARAGMLVALRATPLKWSAFQRRMALRGCLRDLQNPTMSLEDISLPVIRAVELLILAS